MIKVGDSLFDPKIHICKFGYEFHGVGILECWYSISGDLYLKELKIDFWKLQTDGSKNIIDTVGFELSDGQINEMLPLLEVEKFEKFRDLPSGWEFDPAYGGNSGYRDGWGYWFWYMSEYGTPLFQINMSMLFAEKNNPPYERLLEWLRERYKDNKQLKKKEILW